MLSEYDLHGKKGVCGEYYRTYQEGHTVRIQQENGSTDDNHH